MTSTDLTKLAIAAGILFGVYKFAPGHAAKAMVLGVAGVVIGKQLPYVQDVLA